MVLSKTSSNSALVPDGISYRFIKLVAITPLGDKLVTDIAELIMNGEILGEWQKSKVVIISKPRKDSKSTKA